MNQARYFFLLSACALFLTACGGGDNNTADSGIIIAPTPDPSAQNPDSDGDGVPDELDAFPNDASESKDTDGDGVGDLADAFPNDAKETLDSDGDGVGDNADAFPNDATETKDTDGDGVGNIADQLPFNASETIDSDGDGVGDNSDAFPSDASEWADTDGDGVGDNSDVFPADPLETVDADMDGVGDNSDIFPNDSSEWGDSDMDGVQDGMDACPNTPAGVKVDAKGCALDSDKDGVADHKDSCPDTAMQLKVDTKGCPVQLSEAVSIDLKVNFDSNSSVVKSDYFAEIRKVADFMAQYENSVVVIEGHTDTRGAAAYNKSLSQKRANAVAAVLVSEMGVAQRRVTAVGYGEEQPIADESTREGLIANRRVVAKVSASVTKLEQK